MQSLEQEIASIDQNLNNLSADQVRAIDRTFRELTSVQRNYVQEVLEQAKQFETTSSRYLDMLEYFFEKWHSHSLATRLALVGRIQRLAQSHHVTHTTVETAWDHGMELVGNRGYSAAASA